MSASTAVASGRTPRAPDPSDYARRVTVGAPRERVVDALATVDGLRGGGASDVSGTGALGDVVRFGFALPAHDEWIVMRVDRAHRPEAVGWTCVAQYVAPQGLTRHDEWVGTRLTFDLEAAGADACVLHFAHAGLTPALECYGVCARGWDHFLASLTGYVERGAGTPFGA